MGFGHYYRACPIRLGPESAAAAEKQILAKGGGKDWNGGRGKGKGKGRHTGYGKKGVYGIDHFEDNAWEGELVVWAASAAADAEWAKESAGVGAVYDQDEQYDEFCGCIMCDVEDEEEFDTGSVSISEISGGEFVCGVDTDSDDDLVTSGCRGLRDVDG